jgi:hypothetical protein
LTELHLILKYSDLGGEALVSWDEDNNMGYTRTRELYYRNGFSLRNIPIRYSVKSIYLLPVEQNFDEELRKVSLWFNELRDNTEVERQQETPMLPGNYLVGEPCFKHGFHFPCTHHNHDKIFKINKVPCNQSTRQYCCLHDGSIRYDP